MLFSFSIYHALPKQSVVRNRTDQGKLVRMLTFEDISATQHRDAFLHTQFTILVHYLNVFKINLWPYLTNGSFNYKFATEY